MPVSVDARAWNASGDSARSQTTNRHGCSFPDEGAHRAASKRRSRSGRDTARARLVDNEALAELLRAGRLRGAALDVHETEPPPLDYAFRTMPNVLITPHIGYNTAEASSNMLRIAIETVEAFARGERLHVVNGV